MTNQTITIFIYYLFIVLVTTVNSEKSINLEYQTSRQHACRLSTRFTKEYYRDERNQDFKSETTSNNQISSKFCGKIKEKLCCDDKRLENMANYWKESPKKDGNKDESNKVAKKLELSPKQKILNWTRDLNSEQKLMLTKGLPSLIKLYQTIVQTLPDTNKCKQGINNFLYQISAKSYDLTSLNNEYFSQTERCYRYTTQLQNGFMCGLCNFAQKEKISLFTEYIQLNEAECRTFSRACVPRLHTIKKILSVIVSAYSASKCNRATQKIKTNYYNLAIPDEVMEVPSNINRDERNTRRIQQINKFKRDREMYQTEMLSVYFSEHSKKDIWECYKEYGNISILISNFKNKARLIHSCQHTCRRFFSQDGITKMDSQVGPLISQLIENIKENEKNEDTLQDSSFFNNKEEKAQIYPFLTMDIDRWQYYKEKRTLDQNDLYKNIHNWRFLDYNIQFTKNGANLIKQGLNSGFEKLDHRVMSGSNIIEFIQKFSAVILTIFLLEIV